MGYVQMTLDDWIILKDQLKQDIIDAQNKITGLKKDFVRIGYKLRKIEEMKLYENDGYKSIAEFAKAECSLTPSDVTRFIKINERYSIGGYSEELREEFLQFGSSKLAEMLALPDSDIEAIRPEVSRESIRDLKRFNKEESEQESNTWDELLLKFFDDNNDALIMLYENMKSPIKELIEIVNPSGTRTYRKGLFFLMMYEDSLRYKKHGGEWQELTWQQFFEDTWRLFGSREEFKKEKLSTKPCEADAKSCEVKRLSQKTDIEEPKKEEKNIHLPPEKLKTTKTGNEKAEKPPKIEPKKEEEKPHEVQQTLNSVAPAQLKSEPEEKLEIPEPEKEETKEDFPMQEPLETVTIFEKLKKKTLSEFAQWASKVGCPPGSSCNGEHNEEKCQNCWELYLNQYEVEERSE